MFGKVAVVLVAVLALGLASCGGSEETTTLSRAELVKQIQVACREGQRASERQSREARGSDDGNSGFINAVLAGQKVVNDKLNSITTSGAAKADFEALKQSVGSRTELIERVAAADRAHQEQMIRSVQREIEAATARAQQAARDLGIEGCI
jgi:hypothetical protein